MAGNHLEDLVAEWYQFQGFFVRRNIQVGKRLRGGYECELDIVAFQPRGNASCMWSHGSMPTAGRPERSDAAKNLMPGDGSFPGSSAASACRARRSKSHSLCSPGGGGATPSAAVELSSSRTSCATFSRLWEVPCRECRDS
jgi:hypothetical protein